MKSPGWLLPSNSPPGKPTADALGVPRDAALRSAAGTPSRSLWPKPRLFISWRSAEEEQLPGNSLPGGSEAGPRKCKLPTAAAPPRPPQHRGHRPGPAAARKPPRATAPAPGAAPLAPARPYLHAQPLLQHQRGAQVPGAAHEQLVGAALEEGERGADLAQLPELAQRPRVVGQPQGAVDQRGHRVHPGAAQQEGGAGVGVGLAASLLVAQAGVHDAAGGPQVRVPRRREQRALRDVVQHVGHAGHAAVQPARAAAGAAQGRQLPQDALDGGRHQRHRRLPVRRRRGAARVVIEAVGEAALALHPPPARPLCAAGSGGRELPAEGAEGARGRRAGRQRRGGKGALPPPAAAGRGGRGRCRPGAMGDAGREPRRSRSGSGSARSVPAQRPSSAAAPPALGERFSAAARSGRGRPGSPDLRHARGRAGSGVQLVLPWGSPFTQCITFARAVCASPRKRV